MWDLHDGWWSAWSSTLTFRRLEPVLGPSEWAAVCPAGCRATTGWPHSRVISSRLAPTVTFLAPLHRPRKVATSNALSSSSDKMSCI